MPSAKSTPPPPRYVEYTGAEPVGSSLMTKASWTPPNAGWAAPAVVGKLGEMVDPVT